MELDPDLPSPFNPLSGNPLRSRDDVLRAFYDAHLPLDPIVEQGDWHALDPCSATYDMRAQSLEALARPLWGLAAAAAGGEVHPSWPHYVAAIVNGTDPDHPHFWREAGHYDQRLVELAAIGFALCMAPAQTWEPLTAYERSRLSGYLRRAAQQPVFDNNWKFFPILIDLGLHKVGEAGCGEIATRLLDEIEQWTIGNGWYRDGPTGLIDHYNGFAFHFYGLIYAALAPDDDERAKALRDRATLFASHYRRWFADDGGPLPLGRSLAYRFAPSAFFGACALAGIEGTDWGRLKGDYLRSLRWWRRWPITRRDGLLSVGYAYPNMQMAESYNGPASPYWAFKAFLPLALGADHPFWSTPEIQRTTDHDATVIQAEPAMIFMSEPCQTIALCAGQTSPAHIRWGAEKYAKFAYSTRYAFSIESDMRRFDRCTFDSMIAFADEKGDWRVRTGSQKNAIFEDVLWSRWHPWDDVVIDTWLYADGPWHVRVHRIDTPRALNTIEGGFSMARPEGQAEGAANQASAYCKGDADFTGLADLLPGMRRGRFGGLEPHTNLLHPRTVTPQLIGPIAAGRTQLSCAVLASPDVAMAARAWLSPPAPRQMLPLS